MSARFSGVVLKNGVITGIDLGLSGDATISGDVKSDNYYKEDGSLWLPKTPCVSWTSSLTQNVNNGATRTIQFDGEKFDQDWGDSPGTQCQIPEDGFYLISCGSGLNKKSNPTAATANVRIALTGSALTTAKYINVPWGTNSTNCCASLSALILADEGDNIEVEVQNNSGVQQQTCNSNRNWLTVFKVRN